MERNVIFEEKVYLSPKDMNRVSKESIDTILMKHLREKLENKCSQHGFVIPKSLSMLSRSMGLIENGRFTGSIVFHIQAQGRVYNPVNGTRITGTILKRNKMGLYVIYRDAIRILVPRDSHLGNQEFEELQVGDTIEIEIRKSRFQIQDPFIISVGVLVGRKGEATDVAEEAAVDAEAAEEEATPNDMPALEPAPAAEDAEDNLLPDAEDNDELLGDVALPDEETEAEVA